MQLREDIPKSTATGPDDRKKYKRKGGSKSRLLQKVKKFGKQGKLGRGFEIDEETYNYFCRVLELWNKQEFDGEEERESFVENSFTQTEGSEVNYSSNQMTSRIIETILPFASQDVVTRFLTAFSPSLRTICCDPFASHVLEKLLEITSSDKFADNPKMTEWFKQTSMYVFNNLEEFTFNQYANHIMRKVFQCLSGNVTQTGQKIMKLTIDLPHKKRPLTDKGESVFGERKKNKQFQKILGDFFVRFINWPQFFDLFQTEITSGLVQALLKAVSLMDPIGVQAGVDKTLKAIGPEIDLSNSVAANLGTRIIESCLSICDELYWGKIYGLYFEGKLQTFATHEKGHFSLKKLLETCPNKSRFEEIFDNLHGSFEEMYKARHTSLFPALAEGCKKYQTRQNQFLQSILNLLGYDESGKNSQNDNFIQILARFGQKLQLKDDGTPLYITDFAGTVTLQHLMEFHKPQKIISSMLEMDSPELSKLSCDPKGSHITQTFFNSSTIGEKNKEKLLQKLKEYLINLSTNKFGSRVMDVIWVWANIKNKAVVAAALSDRITPLSANLFGKFIVEKCALHVYKRDPKLWAESIEKSSKRKQEAVDLLNELENATTSKKKKKKHSEIEEEIHPVEEQPMDEDEGEIKRKKKKSKKDKSKNEESMIKETQEEELAEEDVGEKKRKKKNKRKSEAVEDSTLNETIAEESLADFEEKPKKKKKKSRKSEIAE